jgi:hypothetical protein
MALPSIAYVTRHARETWRRFPDVLTSSLLAAFFAMWMVEDISKDPTVMRLFMACALGIPLFFSLRMYGERPAGRFKPPAAARLLGGALLLAGISLSTRGVLTDNTYLRYAQWSLVIHAFAAFSPFLGRREENGFWQFNRALFQRFCLSFGYAMVFHVGLAAALAAMDALLGMKVHGKIYMDLWIFSVFVVQTWHFLAGVPSSVEALENERDYPAGLKVFAQYMLVPLVSLYALILYVYMGKIIATQVWPKGTVTGLVSGLSVFGVLTLLLLHPAREREENLWIKVFSRGFYAGMLPLLAMLFMAIWKRVGPYGITEQRYFLIVLALWITAMAFYFLRSREWNIKVVPVSLCLVALTTSFGPWGAYGTSRFSQQRRLKGILAKNGLWVENKAVTPASTLPWEEAKQISSILTYLLENHGLRALKGWFDAGLPDVNKNAPLGSPEAQRVAALICNSLGIKFYQPWETAASNARFSFYTGGQQSWDVRGYDFLVSLRNGYTPEAGFMLDNNPYRSVLKGGTWEVREDARPLLQFDLAGLARRLDVTPQSGAVSFPREQMKAEAEGPEWKAVFYLDTLAGEREKTGLRVTSLSGTLLVKNKIRR